MLDMRKRIIVYGIVGSLVVALVVGVGSWLLRTQSNPVPEPVTGGGSTSGSTSTGTGLNPVNNGLTPPTTTLPTSPGTESTGTPPAQQPPETTTLSNPTRVVIQPQDQELVSITYSFAQVFGSYSNQGGFDNIERLRFLMSAAMNQWADRFIADRSKNTNTPPADLYNGITTTTLSSSIMSRTDSRAVVKAQTQRKEVRGVLSNARYMLEDLTITFVREEGLWKVDSAVWSNQRVLGASSNTSAP